MATMAGGGEHGRDARVGARGRDEVFPGLEVCIWFGVLAGLSLSLLIAGLLGYSDWEFLSLVGTGVGLGAIVGLFAGLGRGVWRPGSPVRVPEPEAASTPEPATATAPGPELWDPWLDHGRDVDAALPEVVIDEPAPAAAEIPEVPVLARAPVRPRVISPETGEAIRLDDEIGPMIQEGRGGLIVILGGPGLGKTTALQHLAAILPPWARGRVRLLEVLDLTAIASAGPDPLVVLALETNDAAKPGYEKVLLGYPAHEQATLDHLISSGRPALYRLAPWSQDDAIEYLLATDREACASVMGRLRASGDFSFLDGIPELCSVVLDRMARDESIVDVRTALRGELAARIDGTSVRRDSIEDLCVDAFRDTVNDEMTPAVTRMTGSDPLGPHLARLVRHRPVALLLAAGRIAALLERGRATRALTHRFPREVVLEVARQIVASDTAIHHLGDWIKGNMRGVHPLVASLLHAATPGWRPDPDCRPRLEAASLDGVVWPGQNLAGVNLRWASMRDADLSGANLERASAKRACLHGADLRRANLRHCMATQADLGRANLARATAQHARLRGADLADVRLIDADLWKADLAEARIEGADFTGANLEDSNLRGLPLRLARLDGARFGGADLSGCDLEAILLPEADFHDAKLCGAILTDSRLPGANFRGANLRDTKLAEIDWPGACLRDADLRGANFHLGTTRSGKLDSPIACEGSRTGFYTHDDLDRHIRPAEDVRKANLRGADLRGALIENVDFYLVDLRDARYTEAQARHLRHCRAILDEPST